MSSNFFPPNLLFDNSPSRKKRFPDDFTVKPTQPQSGSSSSGGGYSRSYGYSGGGGGGGGGGPVTTVDTRIEHASKPETRARVNQVMRDLLGREATKGEMKKMYDLIREVEDDRPTVTTTTRDGSNSSSTVNVGANDIVKNQLIAEDVQDTDEYASFQAATTYMDAFLQAIDNPLVD